MATFQDRVEDLVGTVSDTTALTEWLTEGAHRVVSLIPADRLYEFASTVSVPEAGYSLAGARFVSAAKSDILAPMRPPYLAAALADATSMHCATAASPASFIKGGVLKVLPGGGEAQVVTLPSVTVGDSSISTWPNDYEQVVVLHAAVAAKIQAIRSQLATDLEAAASAPLSASIDLASHFTALNGYVVTEEDIELAQAKMQEIQTLLAEFTAEKGVEANQYSSRITQVMQEHQARLLELRELKELYMSAIAMTFGVKGESE